MTAQAFNLWVGGQEKPGHAEQFVTFPSSLLRVDPARA